MGLDVSDEKFVTINDLHERRLATSVLSRCYNFTAEGGLRVECVFRRVLGPETRNDGIPLMYALKRKHGYDIESMSRRKLYRRAIKIGSQRIKPGMFDVIVPAPSSSNVPSYMASRISRLLNEGISVRDIFRKPTVGHVLRTAPPIAVVRPRDMRDFKSALALIQRANPVAHFEIKSVGQRARAYFDTVEILPSTLIPHHLRILIVDDSAETGATLQKCANLLRQYFRPISVTGLVLVGPT